jgi:hypothetical protein
MMAFSSNFDVLMLKRLEEIVERRLQMLMRERKKLGVCVPITTRGEGVKAWKISGKSASQSQSRIVDGRPSSKDSFLRVFNQSNFPRNDI